MLSKISSVAVNGLDVHPVEVEVNEVPGEVAIAVVGSSEAGGKESKDRIGAALVNSGYEFSLGRTTINLTPAGVKKEDPSFDLPIALGILVATEQMETDQLDNFAAVGELTRTGAVRRCKGVLPIALRARSEGKVGILVPAENAAEAGVVCGLQVIPVQNLCQTVRFMEGRIKIAPVKVDLHEIFHRHAADEPDFADVEGQEFVKRALEIAAAGAHCLLLSGPSGTAKSMLAKRIPTILPPLSLAEALETTKIHSIMGLLEPGQALVTRRPFRAPHFVDSAASILGCGIKFVPGDISLAHNGVLFLDRWPEFKSSVLERMCQSLEEGIVTISRPARNLTFPCDIMLAVGMDPVPHGNKLHESGRPASEIQKHLEPISRMLLDRIDLYIEMPAIKFHGNSTGRVGETSKQVRERVIAARQRQHRRFRDHKHITCNARMSAKDLEEFCATDVACKRLLDHATTEMGYSGRAYIRILKIARTIADLAGSDSITRDHVREALPISLP